jgi:hypothetical protein
MNHLNEGELTDTFYGDSSADMRDHLESCADCRLRLAQLSDFLEMVRDVPVPNRGPGYGGEVWARLLPHLPLEKPKRRFIRWWTIAPAFATLLAVAFVAGIFVEHKRQEGTAPRTQERVLLLAMSEHLERSQILLAELLNGSGNTVNLSLERTRARDLLDENRLLRQTAARAGDLSRTALLEELERTLLNVANGSGNGSDALNAVRQQIEDNGLLFKVRIAGVNTREEGEKL